MRKLQRVLEKMPQRIKGVNEGLKLTASIVLALITYITQKSEVERIFCIDARARYYFIFRIIAFLCSVILYAFLINKIIQLFSREEFERKKAIFFSIYFFINIIVLLFVWPGIYKGDEFYVLPTLVNDLTIVWNQSFFTNLQYIISLMIFPYLAGITFIQIVIICGIATDIYSILSKEINNTKWAGWLLIPFLLLPVIDNNMFTLRTSIISWILADVFVTIYTNFKKDKIPEKFFYLKLIICVCFISVWKSEYVYMMAVIAILFIILHKDNMRRVICLAIAMLLCFLCFSFPSKIKEPDSNYVMTSVLTPLSYIVHENYNDLLNNHELEKQVRIIDEGSSLTDIYSSCSGINLPISYWRLPVLEKESLKEWMKAAVEICLYYKRDFMSNRIYLYLYTNGMVPDVVNHTGSEDEEIVLDLKYGNRYFFDEHFSYTSPPLGESLRRNAISFIACRNYGDYQKTNFLYGILYNSIFPLIILVIHSLISLVKRNFEKLFFDIALLMVVPIVFILAPAHFWMYYMPFYLTSYIMLTIYIINAFLHGNTELHNYSLYFKLKEKNEKNI